MIQKVDYRRRGRLNMELLDNLGKGASGAAVQNLNIMAGLDETSGLRLQTRLFANGVHRVSLATS